MLEAFHEYHRQRAAQQGWQLVEIWDADAKRLFVGVLPIWESEIFRTSVEAELHAVHLSRNGDESAKIAVQLMIQSHRKKRTRL